MKFKTMRMTKECTFCRTAITFKNEQRLKELEKTEGPYLHTVCKKPYKNLQTK